MATSKTARTFDAFFKDIIENLFFSDFHDQQQSRFSRLSRNKNINNIINNNNINNNNNNDDDFSNINIRNNSNNNSNDDSNDNINESNNLNFKSRSTTPVNGKV
ncbi:hypothetical protein HELRODRAFT_184738 [Helobdella robusta]|uniref:Uncharacterized protein n=1 Tax=Helobdella robusta TaxID=6412 RepID=T1FLW5_HELRO|nr:hypothetical protein HELRODRAFT_184738 [Helobdella robusta]ESO01461.1 hypothetical protein HELRODRAFT_184738 [Helobdella robusta]